MRRVVVTGMSAISTLGRTPEEIMASLRAGRNATMRVEEWKDVTGLRSQLYAFIPGGYKTPSYLTRKQLRTMSSVSVMAVDCTRAAVEDAGLTGSPELENGRTGVAYGSCIGSMSAYASCDSLMKQHTTRDLTSSFYIRLMGHTTAVNLSLYFHTTGRLVNSSTACTSSGIAIGESYELIAAGKQDIMLAGGAEHGSLFHTAVFDTLFAASTQNDTPELTPAPFDAKRDGLVLGEGACTLVLEELEHAKARGAHIYAEVVGYATNTDGVHATNPNSATQAAAMREALRDAGLTPDQIGYVSAHGTGTRNGDTAEIRATMDCFQRAVPINSLKGYTGHTLGACGALEAMVGILEMREGWFHPTPNLQEVDPECSGPDFIMGEGREMDVEYIMSNNFAFGGINTSLIFRRWAE